MWSSFDPKRDTIQLQDVKYVSFKYHILNNIVQNDSAIDIILIWETTQSEETID